MADASFAENPPTGTEKFQDTTPAQTQLPTPEASVGPDEERNRADQQRRLTENSSTTEQDGASANAESQPSQQAGATASAGSQPSQQGAASANAGSQPSQQSGASANGGDSQASKQHTNQKPAKSVKPASNNQKSSVIGQSKRVGGKGNNEEMEKAIKDVLRCDRKDCRRILGVSKQANQEACQQAWGRMMLLTNPKRLTKPSQALKKRAQDAHESEYTSTAIG